MDLKGGISGGTLASMMVVLDQASKEDLMNNHLLDPTPAEQGQFSANFANLQWLIIVRTDLINRDREAILPRYDPDLKWVLFLSVINLSYHSFMTSHSISHNHTILTNTVPGLGRTCSSWPRPTLVSFGDQQDICNPKTLVILRTLSTCKYFIFQNDTWTYIVCSVKTKQRQHWFEVSSLLFSLPRSLWSWWFVLSAKLSSA